MRILKKQTNIFWISTLSVLILYFFYHIIAGEYGLVSYFRSYQDLNNKINLSEDILRDIEVMKNKINKMKDGSVDVDILDEEVRDKLGHSKENEIVIYTKDLEDL